MSQTKRTLFVPLKKPMSKWVVTLTLFVPVLVRIVACCLDNDKILIWNFLLGASYPKFFLDHTMEDFEKLTTLNYLGQAYVAHVRNDICAGVQQDRN